jgi:hypothetical protein
LKSGKKINDYCLNKCCHFDQDILDTAENGQTAKKYLKINETFASEIRSIHEGSFKA